MSVHDGGGTKPLPEKDEKFAFDQGLRSGGAISVPWPVVLPLATRTPTPYHVP
jgi:hypothetical protein